MKKIILYDSNYYEYILKKNLKVGGATVELHSWIHGLIENDYDVAVFSNNVPENSINIDGIDFFNVKKVTNSYKKVTMTYFNLYKKIKDIKPDYVFQECAGTITGILSNICYRLGIPFIYRIANDVEVDKRINKKL